MGKNTYFIAGRRNGKIHTALKVMGLLMADTTAVTVIVDDEIIHEVIGGLDKREFERIIQRILQKPGTKFISFTREDNDDTKIRNNPE